MNWIRCLLAFVVLQVLAFPTLAQPLSQGVETSDGWGYFLDKGRLFQLDPEGSLLELNELEKLQALHQAPGWGDTFLASNESGVYRITSKGWELTSNQLLKGEQTLIRWGEGFLAQAKDGSTLSLLLAGLERSISSQGQFSKLHVLDAERAVVKSGYQFLLLNQDDPENPESIELPFEADKAELVVADGRVVFCHPESNKVFELTTKKEMLFELPVNFGLKVLSGGEVLAAGSKQLVLIDTNLFYRSLLPPKELSRDALQRAHAFVRHKTLFYIFEERGFPEIIMYRPDRRIESKNLPPGKLHSVVAPKFTEPGHPMVFITTEFEEEVVDDKGLPVFNLESKTRKKTIIRGHKLYVYQNNEQWELLADEPRAELVGPVERVGNTVVYATQTHALNQIGLKREINYRYPYQQVVLRGQSLVTPVKNWKYEVPRGESPSKARLPLNSWPRLDTNGPLVLTSEGAQALAIDPAEGKLLWSSPELDVDEAAPAMLGWRKRLGLVAASGTSKSLLVLDPNDGSLLSSGYLTELFDSQKWWHLVGVAVLCLALAYYIYAARKKDLYIRKIAGLQALDEAVGRATEMGKPVLYVTGLADVDDIQTLAALSILSHVARKTAEYDTPIVATTSRAVTFSAAQEVVKDAFTIAGRPDAFSVESVRYISDDQFGYTAGVDGIMVREEPAANFFMGKFYGESLILAETGHATGAIQIAGTAAPSQLPFFVAACDYTLIGEELFAASAYLSRDPMQVGSLLGQDVGKAIVMLFLVLGSLYVTMPSGIQSSILGFYQGLPFLVQGALAGGVLLASVFVARLFVKGGEQE